MGSTYVETFFEADRAARRRRAVSRYQPVREFVTAHHSLRGIFDAEREAAKALEAATKQREETLQRWANETAPIKSGEVWGYPGELDEGLWLVVCPVVSIEDTLLTVGAYEVEAVVQGHPTGDAETFHHDHFDRMVLVGHMVDGQLEWLPRVAS